MQAIRFLLGVFFLATTVVAWAEEEYQPRAELVAEDVYVIVGPTTQRAKWNDGLNANYGFVLTPEGVLLIDSGASYQGAQKIQAAVQEVTDKTIRWVINTGSQDHRWLGNDYFSSRGAKIISLERTQQTQRQFSEQHLKNLEKFLGERLQGTVPLQADMALTESDAQLNLGGVEVKLIYTDAHFPGDAMVYLPQKSAVFTGDLVYTDRMLGIHPWSSVRKAKQAFDVLEQLSPKHVVPGHGAPGGLDKARSDSGDYYTFLTEVIAEAAQNMEPMAETVERYSNLPQFRHLGHYDDWHRTNLNRAFQQFEQE
jgi:glyoxylase-like metal-dependent hydrolase (beta-lactamase superfamily II)